MVPSKFCFISLFFTLMTIGVILADITVKLGLVLEMIFFLGFWRETETRMLLNIYHTDEDPQV